MAGLSRTYSDVTIDKQAQPLKLRQGGSSATGSRVVREEIQALRALAVLLVVLYHFWPGLVPGGFIGVDVFFVISGFLITSMLLRQIKDRGTISLPWFLARRARRLLPAALLTTVASFVLTVLFVPVTYWNQYFSEISASSIYVQNWHLAATSADYFAPHGPSPATHFWSLSVEGQFYLIWPLLMLVSVWALRRHTPRARHGLLIFTLGMATALSLGYSIYETAKNPSLAYFATPARAWEFGLGGLLALLGVYQHQRLKSLTVLSWLGWSMIVAAAFLYTSQTAFPGWAALLPVIGTLAVIRAGIPPLSWGPGSLLKLAPVQFLGDISYSIYLWHWPLLVLTPFVLGSEVTGVTAVAVLATTLLAASATKLLVEDRARMTPTFTKRHRRLTFATGVLATGLVVSLTVGGSAYVSATIARDQRATERVLSSKPRCFGAASRDSQRPCRNPRLRSMVVPSPLEAQKLPNSPCTITEESDKRVRVCAFGTPPDRASATVAVVGDSHVSAFRPAFNYVAKKRNWRMLSIMHSSCPFSRSVPDLREPVRSNCMSWNRQVLQWFKKRPEIETIFVMAHAGNKIVVRSGVDMFRAQQDGHIAAWRALPSHVKRIFVVRDTPTMRGGTLACVQQAMDRNQSPGRTCAVPRGSALKPDAQAAAAIHLNSPRVRLLDLSPLMCSRRKCFPVIGGALAFKDVGHLTAVFADTLGPYLQRALHQ